MVSFQRGTLATVFDFLFPALCTTWCAVSIDLCRNYSSKASYFPANMASSYSPKSTFNLKGRIGSNTIHCGALPFSIVAVIQWLFKGLAWIYLSYIFFPCFCKWIVIKKPTTYPIRHRKTRKT